MPITCLIPCHNEHATLPYLVSQLSQITSILQIIIIDDASTPPVALPNTPHTRLIRLSHQLGKSGAVAAGLPFVKTPDLFLCDADLLYLNFSDFEQAIKTYYTHQLDLLILRRHPAPFINNFFKANLMLSGLRILSLANLRSTYQKFSPKLYSLELAINAYMLKHHKNIAQFYTQYTDLHKVTKFGLISGLKLEFAMYYQLLIDSSYWSQLFRFSPPIVYSDKIATLESGQDGNARVSKTRVRED